MKRNYLIAAAVLSASVAFAGEKTAPPQPPAPTPAAVSLELTPSEKLSYKLLMQENSNVQQEQQRLQQSFTDDVNAFQKIIGTNHPGYKMGPNSTLVKDEPQPTPVPPHTPSTVTPPPAAATPAPTPPATVAPPPAAPAK